MSRGRSGASFASITLGLLIIAACGDTGLQPGIYPNVVDTVTLYALTGTALDLPSAYRMSFPATVVRTDQSSDFDFAFNISAAGQSQLLPTGALQLGIGSAIQKMSQTFKALTTVPGGVYVDSLPVPVDSGTVAVVRSRAVSCPVTASFGYTYSKLQVLAIDTIARSLKMQILTNQNCGYHSLAPGTSNQ